MAISEDMASSWQLPNPGLTFTKHLNPCCGESWSLLITFQEGISYAVLMNLREMVWTKCTQRADNFSSTKLLLQQAASVVFPNSFIMDSETIREAIINPMNPP